MRESHNLMGVFLFMGGWVDLVMLALKKKPYNIGMPCLLIGWYVLEIMGYTPDLSYFPHLACIP